eukprot:2663182-Alexandrium_andersonii.AAC.1
MAFLFCFVGEVDVCGVSCAMSHTGVVGIAVIAGAVCDGALGHAIALGLDIAVLVVAFQSWSVLVPWRLSVGVWLLAVGP